MSASLVFVMGVQRSGTNALFRSLNTPSVTAFNEHLDSPMFDQMFLRPAPVLRPVLEVASGSILAKPISETKRRSVSDVFHEFRAHDLRVVWIYRDPVNCYASHIERWAEFRGAPGAFTAEWNHRNQSVLDALSGYADHIAVVRYGDLVSDPRVLAQLGAFLELSTRYRFKPDSNRGRTVLDQGTVALIEEEAATVWDKLQAARRFLPQPMPSLRRALARVL
jgi:hypothetical protein